MDQPRKRNWWSRNWKWFVPVGCVSVLVLAAGFVALLLALIFGIMRSSDAYTQAVARAKASGAVAEELGTPIKEGFFTTGNINVNGPSGNADLAIPISGPKGRATIYFQAHKSAGQWSFSTLVVEISATHWRINLLTESETAPAPTGRPGPEAGGRGGHLP